MCIFSVDYVLQTFLCSMFSLEVLNSLSLAFLVIGILVVFDICKCVSLTLFLFIVFYRFSPFSPNLQSMVVFFYCQYFWFLLRSHNLVLAVGLACLTLLN